jgi:acetone carboxylase gamma subunit
MNMHIKTQLSDGLNKRGAKRFEYHTTAYCEVDGSKYSIQIQNISKTGVQFYTKTPLRKNVQVRLSWQDPTLGTIESHLLVVRDVQQTNDPLYPHGYGSKFVNLKDETKKNVNRLVEITAEHERKVHEKLLEKTPYKTISEIITHGRAFLRDLLRGKKSLDMVHQFVSEMKDHEKQAFEKADDLSQWTQKIITQHFHCRILLVLLSIPVLRDMKMEEGIKLITDKIQSISCLIAECKKYIEITGIVKGKSGGIHETLNRLVYSHVELSETFTKRVANWQLTNFKRF